MGMPAGSNGARIAVLGAGAWGTTVAKVIAEKGNEVMLWAYEPPVTAAINETHTNPRYLPGVTLPRNLIACSDIAEAASGREYIILAVPSLYLLDTVKQILNVPLSGRGKPPLR
jgi:glycerol-3-phosphate dehydrogenase (NAD(P)+)